MVKSLKNIGREYGWAYKVLRETLGEEEADRVVIAALEGQYKGMTPQEMYAAVFVPKIKH